MDAIYDADMVGTCVPHKLFFDIIRRLPPRALAVCRVVSRKWRATVDDNNLLPADCNRLSVTYCGISDSNYRARWKSCSIAPTATPNERRDHGAPANDDNNNNNTNLFPTGFSNVDGHWVYNSVATAATSWPRITNRSRMRDFIAFSN
jgi:hypothetical protein